MSGLQKASSPPLYEESWIGAFFDVDNTLVSGPAMEVLFFRHLVKLGLVGLPDLGRILWFLARHVPPLSLGPLRRNKPYLIGRFPDFIEPLAEEFVCSTIFPRLSTRATSVLARHQGAGHHIALISGSLDFLVRPVANFLGVSVVHGARLETNGAGYTGRVVAPLPYGEGKRRFVEHLAMKYRLDLTRSYAYGDSPGDLHALQAVGNPLVVNPIRGMARVARQRGWPTTQWA